MTASPHPISPLRQRMIDDMRMRKLSPKTQSGYIRAVRQFAAYLGRSPDTASTEDLRNYQLNLVDHSISPVSLNAAISGLKFFFDITPDRQELMARMPLSTASRSRWSSSLRPNGDLCCYPGSGWSSAASAGLPAFAA